jgi:hypothetical protein
MNDKEKFNINIAGETLTDGPLFLLTLVSLAYTNTQSMSSVYRNRLSMLTQKMQSIPNSNIKEFNTYVKALVKLLAAGGERCEDLAWNLLRAYKATGDEKFTLYIQTKEDAWKDGTINWGANGNEIMLLAENYYKDAEANETWMQVSADKERIIALEAQIQTFKPYTPKRETKREPRADRDRTRKWPKWKDDPPKGSEAKVKTKDGTKYHWCTHHARWTVHKPEECTLASGASAIASAATGTNAPSSRGTRHTAMTTVTADASSDSEYDTGNESDDSNSS